MFFASNATRRRSPLAVIHRLPSQQSQLRSPRSFLLLRAGTTASSSPSSAVLRLHTATAPFDTTTMKAFPTASLLPKEETLAAAFLEQYPTYDGRNTVVTIFDLPLNYYFIKITSAMKGESEMSSSSASGSTNAAGSTYNNEAMYHAYAPARQYVFEPRTPVVSLHTNSYNISTAAGSQGLSALAPMPWTADEHERFLDALERYGASVQFTSAEMVWRAIAQAVHTRAPHDVKMHATQYFSELQIASAQKRNEHLFMQSVDAHWTLEDDERFEHLLAVHAANRDASVCYPWERIAAQMFGKSPRDVQERYHKLCYDIARVEAGNHILMSYGGRVQRNRSTPATDDVGMKDSSSLEPAQGWDCVVTLTADEEALLMQALAQARVSPRASPQLLEAVASAMAALTNARSKIPPQRTNALFTFDDACEMFEELLQEQQQHAPADRDSSMHQSPVDPEAILELIVRRLQLRSDDSSSDNINVDNASDAAAGSAWSESMQRSSDRLLQPLASHTTAKAGLVMRDAAPAPLYSPERYYRADAPAKSDATQRAELVDASTAPSSSGSSSDTGRVGHDSLQQQQQQRHQPHSRAMPGVVRPMHTRSHDLDPLYSPPPNSNSSSSAFPTHAALPAPFPHYSAASLTQRVGSRSSGRTSSGGGGGGMLTRSGRTRRSSVFDIARDDHVTTGRHTLNRLQMHEEEDSNDEGEYALAMQDGDM